MNALLAKQTFNSLLAAARKGEEMEVLEEQFQAEIGSLPVSVIKQLGEMFRYPVATMSGKSLKAHFMKAIMHVSLQAARN